MSCGDGACREEGVEGEGRREKSYLLGRKGPAISRTRGEDSAGVAARDVERCSHSRLDLGEGVSPGTRKESPEERPPSTYGLDSRGAPGLYIKAPCRHDLSLNTQRNHERYGACSGINIDGAPGASTGAAPDAGCSRGGGSSCR